MVVLALIGLLIAIGLPSFNNIRIQTQHTRVMNDLRSFTTELQNYRMEAIGWPPSTTAKVIPPEVLNAGYMANADWSEATPVGGYYRWAANEYSTQAALVINEPTRPATQMIKLDARLDDGDLTTGKFRAVGNSYICILEE